MEIKLLHPLNAPLPIFLIEGGIIIWFKEQQFWKDHEGISFMEEFMDIRQFQLM